MRSVEVSTSGVFPPVHSAGEVSATWACRQTGIEKIELLLVLRRVAGLLPHPRLCGRQKAELFAAVSEVIRLRCDLPKAEEGSCGSDGKEKKTSFTPKRSAERSQLRLRRLERSGSICATCQRRSHQGMDHQHSMECRSFESRGHLGRWRC